MTADAMDVINAVLREYPKGAIRFVDVTNNPNYSLHDGRGVLVFGSAPKNAFPFAVRTLSMAQITTKANAFSVLQAAFNQFYMPVIARPRKPGPYRAWSNLDPELPTAIDIETSGNLDNELPEEVDIINIAFYQEGKWAYLNKDNIGYMSDSNWYKEIRESVEFFKNPIWHNSKFDIRVIEARTGYRPAMYFDTMLAHHVLNQAAGDHKLKHLARQYLGAPEWEQDLSKWTVGGAHYENIPSDRLIEYNAWDVYWTHELWKYLEPRILADDNSSKAFMLEMAASGS